MKENIEKITKQMSEDQLTMNIVSWQAQEVILNPDLPETYKDEVVEAAVETILQIGEDRKTYTAMIEAHNGKRESYNANQRESRRLKRSQTIYEAK